MYVYEAKVQSDGIIDKLKLKIVVRGDLHNKDLIGGTLSPISPMRNLKYFLADSVNHKARVHQVDFIGALLQAKVKNRLLVILDSRYKDYFPEYYGYFGRALRLPKSMYVITMESYFIMS